MLSHQDRVLKLSDTRNTMATGMGGPYKDASYAAQAVIPNLFSKIRQNYSYLTNNYSVRSKLHVRQYKTLQESA